MHGFKHILVPTDFGDAAGEACEWAVALATKFDASITLLHVVPPPSYTYAYMTIPYWPAEEIERAARQSLDGAKAKLVQHYPRVEAVLGSGVAWEQVLSVARDRGVDLIVMGTHGRHGLSRALLGSVAEKVVRLSPVPVFTVAGHESSGGAARGAPAAG